MLVTYEEGPGCVKSSLKDPLSHLIKELKVLKANDISNPGSSLSTIFDLLNVYRIYHGIDTPGSGRFPGTIEPTIILWFTDGGKQSSASGTLDRLNIPGITTAGVDYYHEPFRWDQRLYTVFLEPNTETVDPQLSILSTVMGGTSYRVRTLRHMLQAMDCMLGMSKIPPTQYSPQAVLHIYGVVVNFEDLIVDPRRPNTANHHQLIYVNPSWLNPQSRHPGFFPIPEPFWPEIDAQRIPTRNAQPTIHYHTKEEKCIDIPDGFPYDKYVVAPCPMTQELLTRSPGTCWPVYIKNSYKTEGFGFPFGFLKANTSKNAVTLTVVAYNYPALFTLLVNLNSIPSRTPTAEWLRDFAEYLSHTPSYYYSPLRNALKRIGLFNVIQPDQGMMSQAVLKILGKNKIQAKAELDRFLTIEAIAPVDAVGPKKKTLCGNAFDVPRSELIPVLDDMKRAFFRDLQITSISTTLAYASETSHSLIPSASRSTSGVMRTAALKLDSIVDSDDLHSLPIADMGIYQDRMQKIQQETLRDPFRDEESVKSLQRTMFGNPYKQDKKVSIDEEDEASAAGQSLSTNSSSGGSSWSSILGRKRRPRRRSVSPSHFPIEKVPSLARSDRSTSTKTLVVSFGAPSGKTAMPLLNIMIQHGSGKVQSIVDSTEGLGLHMVMHDGEDEDEDDDDFRRAMFNSDEMELDGEDETARLRADTPMPGGMGLDDDDEEMEELQHAQDLIPPPIIPMTLNDIVDSQSDSLYQSKDGVTANHLKHERVDNRQEREGNPEHTDEVAKPVFEGLVYDPTASLELQSIPHTIPERTEPQTTTEMLPVRPTSYDLSMHGDSESEHISLATDAESNLSKSSQNLTPVPILYSPSAENNIHSSETVTIPVSLEGNVSAEASLALMRSPLESMVLDDASISPRQGKPVPSTSAPVITSSTFELNDPCSMEARNLDKEYVVAQEQVLSLQQEHISFQKTPAEIKNKIVAQLKKGPKGYNEGTIINLLWQINEAPNWNKEQKRAAVMGCLNFAKGLRRGAVVSVLETIAHNISR
ncbi:hypothetical protein BCR41DRAFT_364030 [Lobosporangium transversale]|uniref:Integrator complex subunit 6-like beta-barrel domain-containing protein n=1 Tax=Lobosporangium transversale TaxID=64571 RepID=A0A1Y2G717_9FUNG|nr:hypothetical protein BCR41DRAFT_364030 [Lobosporangium transversale]ORY99523.1 hypothetical protein BCR41DRAFT_364030 [Lobosporangium transversale]|eukprot:XP_021875849.1 hypothetical protein BCR41DRAFT_364030 [Lobosporangium transversale]